MLSTRLWPPTSADAEDAESDESAESAESGKLTTAAMVVREARLTTSICRRVMFPYISVPRYLEITCIDDDRENHTRLLPRVQVALPL
jgi:hypothetical protein